MIAPLQFLLRPETLQVHRLPPDHPVDFAALAGLSWYSVTRTDEEISIVAPAGFEPGAGECAPDWACLQVAGVLEFALVGILAAISQILADAGVSLFAISTYNTDYILIGRADVDTAVSALVAAGHRVTAHPGMRR